jgi:hypothetical protein
MKKPGLFLIAAVCCLSVVVAQETYYSIFNYSHFIPKVSINDRSVSLQGGLYPKFYETRSAARDMRWVAQNDSLLVAFWSEKGDTILHILTELAGIEWYEAEFDIYLVRYFPTIGSADPLIVPTGGLKTGSLIEAAPSANHMALNLIFQLSKRILAQTVQPEDSIYLRIADHPLMRFGPYRRDNLAMLLTVATCQNIIGLDSTYDAYNSAFWLEHTPGRKIFELYFLNKWILTPDHTLADWIAEEPYGSRLVSITRPPLMPKRSASPRNIVFIEGLPLKGQLGFSVRIDEANYLMVDTIDVYRLAYACGLRVGDRIRTVDGYRVKTHRQLVERILDNLEDGGAMLQVLRNDQIETVLIQPMFLPDDSLYIEEEYFLPDDSFQVTPDTTYNESLER